MDAAPFPDFLQNTKKQKLFGSPLAARMADQGEAASLKPDANMDWLQQISSQQMIFRKRYDDTMVIKHITSTLHINLRGLASRLEDAENRISSQEDTVSRMHITAEQ